MAVPRIKEYKLYEHEEQIHGKQLECLAHMYLRERN